MAAASASNRSSWQQETDHPPEVAAVEPARLSFTHSENMLTGTACWNDLHKTENLLNLAETFKNTCASPQKTGGPVALRDSFQVKGPAQETPGRGKVDRLGAGF